MVEYLQNKEETQKTVYFDNMGNRWLHTGDLAAIDKDGFVFIKGRLKRIYTTKNNMGMVFKLYPDYIEQIVSQMDAILSCAVICQPDNIRINIPVLFVVTRRAVEKNDILNHCKELLPEHMIPAKIIFIDSIPLTTVGKINYQVLSSGIKKDS